MYMMVWTYLDILHAVLWKFYPEAMKLICQAGLHMLVYFIAEGLMLLATWLDSDFADDSHLRSYN